MVVHPAADHPGDELQGPGEEVLEEVDGLLSENTDGEIGAEYEEHHDRSAVMYPQGKSSRSSSRNFSWVTFRIPI